MKDWVLTHKLCLILSPNAVSAPGTVHVAGKLLYITVCGKLEIRIFALSFFKKLAGKDSFATEKRTN